MAGCRYAHGIGGFGDLGESAALASSHNGGRRVAGSAHEIRGIARLGGPPGMGSSHRVHRLMGSLLGVSRAMMKGARRIPKPEGGSRPMKIRPLHDRLLVERLEEKEVKKGGIIIPDTAKEKPQEGKVIAVGNGKVTDEGKKVPLDVKAGDKILFGKYSGSEVKLDDKEYLIMREEDVLAILE